MRILSPDHQSLGGFAGARSDRRRVVYQLIPNREVRGAPLRVGALLAAAGFELAKAGFGLYVASVGRYAEVYGALGGVVAFLVFVVANLVIFAAEVTAELLNDRVVGEGGSV